MPDRADESTRLEMAHVLFLDLVGYSRLPLEEQNRSIAALQDIVRGLPTYQQAEADDALLSHPAGDGMALAFFHVPSAPAHRALELAEALSNHDDLPLRMGIHGTGVPRRGRQRGRQRARSRHQPGAARHGLRGRGTARKQDISVLGAIQNALLGHPFIPGRASPAE